jgi:hypothetical protein
MRKPVICNVVSSKSDGFQIEVYFNTCSSMALLLLRLRFVTLKIGRFKITQISQECLGKSEFALDIYKVKSQLLQFFLNGAFTRVQRTLG